MAKRRVKKEVPLTRKQVSRREKERRQRLILIGVAASVGSLIVAILAYGAYVELVAKPASPVAVVNGAPIQTATYQKRVLLERMRIDAEVQELQLQRSRLDPDQDQFLVDYMDQLLSQLWWESSQVDGESFLDELIQGELIRQAAEEQGIAVSDGEMDQLIEESFGYYTEQPTPAPSPTTELITATAEITPTVTPTPMTRARFEELYRDYLSTLQEGAGLSEAEYREILRAELLRAKMEEFVGQQVPASELHIRARHILVETEEEAETLLERLADGEDFAALAEELSQDPASAEQGGDLGWFPRGQMVPEFDEVAFSLSPGEISDLVDSSFGFHIIMVEERDEDRELDSVMLAQRKTEAFQTWLFDLEATATIERYWSGDSLPPE